MVGTCGAVSGPTGSFVRFCMTDSEAMKFATQYGMRGVVALVQPAPDGSSNVQWRRVVGSPVFQLDASDPLHWVWSAVPGSNAVKGNVCIGGLHQVAVFSDVTLPPKLSHHRAIQSWGRPGVFVYH